MEGELLLKRTPIIALAANAMEGDRQRCLDGGMDDHIAKPLNGAVLFEVISPWANGGQDARKMSGQSAESISLHRDG